MGVVVHLIPAHVEARAVGAEDGIGGVEQVGFGVIGAFSDDFFRIGAGQIGGELRAHMAAALGIHAHLLAIGSALGGRCKSAQPLQAVRQRFRRFKLSAHGGQVGHGPADVFLGYNQFQIQVGFQ